MEILEIYCFLIIMSWFLLTVSGNYLNFIKIYIFQTALIFWIFYSMYMSKFESDPMLLFAFIYGIIIRVIWVPFTIHHFLTKLNMPFIERKLHIRWLYALLIQLFMVFFVYMLSKKIGDSHIVLISSILIVFFGLFTFLNHKKLIGDILAFLFIENGLFLLSMLIIEKISFYAEINIMVDILMSLAVLVMSMIKIRSITGNIDVWQFVELKE